MLEGIFTFKHFHCNTVSQSEFCENSFNNNNIIRYRQQIFTTLLSISTVANNANNCSTPRIILYSLVLNWLILWRFSQLLEVRHHFDSYNCLAAQPQQGKSAGLRFSGIWISQASDLLYPIPDKRFPILFIFNPR